MNLTDKKTKIKSDNLTHFIFLKKYFCKQNTEYRNTNIYYCIRFLVLQMVLGTNKENDRRIYTIF